MEKPPSHIRLDQRYPAYVGGAGLIGVIMAAFLPEHYAAASVLMGVCALIGAAYLVTLDVARFTDTAMIVRRTDYPYSNIASVGTTEREVIVPSASGRRQRVIQSSLVLHPPGGGTPHYVDILNARGGAQEVADVLQAHLDRYQTRPGA
jgi:hypothetical protein